MNDRSARHTRVAALFDRVRRLGCDEAAALLRHDGVDAETIAEVVALVDAARNDDFLTPQHASDALERLVGERTLEVGRRLAEAIGGLRILRILGQGAMGVVYLAEQDQPRRHVALKALRAGASSQKLVKRFAREVAVLARLDHEGIARIHLAGTIDTGDGPQPYFVMEYVEGETILGYAETRALPWADRLELLALACDAVEHAHAQGIVHRDLKPDHIVVGPQGHPKVLDFGIARILDSEHAPTTRQTVLGQLLGTVPYMSPEQAGGDLDRIDARSDVYALGVMAFELLTGRLPYEVLGVPIHEAARRIRDDEPTRLSRHDRVFRGDLDTVVSTALAKDPGQRYASAGALAADLRRVLAAEPISARPPGTMRQVVRFARRNRALVTGIVIAFAGMAAATALSVRWAIHAHAMRGEAEEAGRRSREAQREADVARAQSERDAERAERERDAAENTLRFITDDILNRASPDSRGGPLVPMGRILVAAAGRADDRFKGHPESLARVRLVLARTFTALSMPREAAEQADLAGALYLELAETADEPVRRRTIRAEAAEALMVSANASRSMFHFGEAEAAFRRSLGLQLELRPAHHSSITHARLKLGETLSLVGRWDEAEIELREVLAIRERHSSDAPSLLGSVRTSLADLATTRGDPDAAMALLEQARGDLAHLQPAHSLNLWRDQVEAATRVALGDDAGAEALLADLVQRTRSALGEASIRTAGLRSAHAGMLVRFGRTTEALAVLEQAIGTMTHEFGPEHGMTLLSRNARIEALLAHGAVAAAVAEAREVEAGWVAACGPESPFAIDSTVRLATALCVLDRTASEPGLAEEALKVASRSAKSIAAFPAHHALALGAARALGGAEACNGLARAGQARILAALDAAIATWGAAHPETLQTRAALAEAMLLADDAAGAEAETATALDRLSTRAAPWPELRARLLLGNAEASARLGRAAQAEAAARAAYEVGAATWGTEHMFAVRAAALLATLEPGAESRR